MKPPLIEAKCSRDSPGWSGIRCLCRSWRGISWTDGPGSGLDNFWITSCDSVMIQILQAHVNQRGPHISHEMVLKSWTEDAGSSTGEWSTGGAGRAGPPDHTSWGFVRAGSLSLTPSARFQSADAWRTEDWRPDRYKPSSSSLVSSLKHLLDFQDFFFFSFRTIKHLHNSRIYFWSYFKLEYFNYVN